MTNETNKADYPPLPSFEAVEQHVYGACRRFVSQDMLEPIHNLMRAYVDADRAMQAQAAPKYSEVMGIAGQAYFESVGKHAYPLPAMWRWSEVYEAMLAAAPSAPARDATRVAVSTAPERIWLDVGDDDALDCTFRDLVDVTWSDDNATGFGIEYVRADIAAQPTEVPAQGDAEDGWYLQDTRSYVGNDVLWWAKDGKGYTTDLSKAHVYSRDEAFRQAAMRGTDRAWPKAYIDGKTRPAVDMQYINHAEAMATKGESNG